MQIRSLEARVFGGLLILTTALFLWVVRGFLVPVFWAAVFAVIFWPVYQRALRGTGGRPAIAALLSTLAVVVVVLVPLGLLTAAVAQQAFSLYQRISAGEISLSAPIAFVERSLPTVAALFQRYGIDFAQLRATAETAAIAATQYAASQALSFGQNALTTTVLFALMLYFLFFFFRDGERIRNGLIRAIPMGDEREARLFSKFAEVARATVQGTLIVAAVQGALGGIMFGIAGIHAAIFWGVVMGILSLLPAVGAGLVWGPAAIIFFSTGAIGKGLFLVIGGSVVVGLVDNILRPVLIGRQARMPDYLVLLATLGGLAAFGLAGFVAGPVVAALFLVMWEMFADEYAPLDSSEPFAGRVAAGAEGRIEAGREAVAEERESTVADQGETPARPLPNDTGEGEGPGGEQHTASQGRGTPIEREQGRP
jgi:predicted PurR-regulated permease PerM